MENNMKLTTSRKRKSKTAEIIQGLSREAQGLVEALQNWRPTPGSAFPGHDLHGVSQDRADVAGVLAGVKPAALIDPQGFSPKIRRMMLNSDTFFQTDPVVQELIAAGEQQGYVYDEFWDLASEEPTAVFGKAKNVRALRRIHVCTRLEDWQGPDVHVKVGRLLGYPERNIREFVEQDLADYR